MASIEQLMAEVFRLRLLAGLEDLLEVSGYSRVAGVDEAGRGCLAGPVVAAAVISDPERRLPGIDDSKVLSAASRERLSEMIRRTAIGWSVAAVSPAIIDRVNILEATRSAMLQALESLDPQPECAIIDAVSLPAASYPRLPLVRADGFIYSVACASILAKVERDRLMLDLDREYPVYGFAQNKGYAAVGHRRALAEFGPCPVHRLTFRSVVPRRAEVVG